jgi:hypothetical protein
VELVGVSVLYLVLAAWIIVRGRRTLPRLLRDGLRTPYADLQAEPSSP